MNCISERSDFFSLNINLIIGAKLRSRRSRHFEQRLIFSCESANDGRERERDSVRGLSVLTVAAAAVAAVVAAVEGSPHSASMHHLHHYPRLHHLNHNHHRRPHHHRIRVNHLGQLAGQSGNVYSNVVSTEIVATVDGERHCLIQEGSKRWRCKRCNLHGHEKRTKLRCHRCCVALCAPCFQLYHMEKEGHDKFPFGASSGTSSVAYSAQVPQMSGQTYEAPVPLYQQ